MNNTINCKMTIEQKRQLLDSAKGRYFHAKWVKKDGSVREATAKKWEQKYLHGKPGENKNTVAHKPEYYTMCEQAVEGYRNIDLRTLKEVKINGKTYTFDKES